MKVDRKNPSSASAHPSPELENLVVSQPQQQHKELNKPEKPKRQTWTTKRFLGFTFAILSALFLSMGNIFARKASLFSGSELHFMSYSMTLVSMLVVIRARGEHPFGPREHRMIIFVRSCFVVVTSILAKTSVKLISPSDTTAILHTNVILVVLLARVVFKEMLSFVHIFCLFIAITGVFFISQPIFLLSVLSNNAVNEYSNSTLVNTSSSNLNGAKNFSIKSYIGLGMAFLGAFLVALSTVLVKRLNNLKVHFSVMLVYQGYIGVPVCLVVSVLFRHFGFAKHSNENDQDVTTSEDDILEMIMQCVYAFVAASSSLITHIFFNIGLKYEDAAKFSLIRISDLLFTFVLQMLLLHIYANYLSAIGALLIFVSTFLVISYKIIDKKCDENQKKGSLLTKFIFYKF